MLLLGEVLGRWLWSMTQPPLRFMGAMLATVCGGVGLYVVLARWLARRRIG